MSDFSFLLMLLVVLFFSFSLSYYIRKFALHHNHIDSPNERSSHTVATPSGGGIAFVVAFYSAIIYLFFQSFITPSIFYGLIGLLSIAIIGFLDDRNHIPARYRLLIHFSAALWICYWLGVVSLDSVFGQSDHFILILLSWFGTLFYLVWLLNLYNFMDGIDGLATIEAITVSASAGILLMSNGDSAYLAFVLTASLLGFLFWNWPPAKMFMGDVGSAFLGILLGSLSLITSVGGELSFSIWLILLAVFICDATITLLVRLFRGEKIYEAHRSHAYQHLSRKYSHKFVTIGVLLINVFFLLPLAWLANATPNIAILCLLMAYIPLIILSFKSHAGLPEQD